MTYFPSRPTDLRSEKLDQEAEGVKGGREEVQEIRSKERKKEIVEALSQEQHKKMGAMTQENQEDMEQEAGGVRGGK